MKHFTSIVFYVTGLFCISVVLSGCATGLHRSNLTRWKNKSANGIRWEEPKDAYYPSWIHRKKFSCYGYSLHPVFGGWSDPLCLIDFAMYRTSLEDRDSSFVQKERLKYHAEIQIYNDEDKLSRAMYYRKDIHAPDGDIIAIEVKYIQMDFNMQFRDEDNAAIIRMINSVEAYK